MAKFLVLLMVMAAFAVQIAVSDVCDDVEDIPAIITDATAKAIAEGKALVAAEVETVQAAIDATNPAPTAAAKTCLEALKTTDLGTAIKILKTSAKTKLDTCIKDGFTAMEEEIEALCNAAKCRGIFWCIIDAIFKVFGSVVGGFQDLINIIIGGSNKDPLEILEEKVDALLTECIDEAVESVEDDITNADIATKIAAC